MENEPTHAADAEPGDDDLVATLASLQQLIVRYPFAAQALFSTLVQEGRRFAQTKSGAVWKARLQDTELIRRGRAVWEVISFDVLEEDEQTVLPSKLLESFVEATSLDDVERRLAELLLKAPKQWRGPGSGSP